MDHKEKIMRQRVLFFVLLLSLLIAVAPMTGAQEDRLQIVGSHSILTDVITNVAGDVADVTSVMPRGADPHSFQPTPSDLTALADADVVFINGIFFEEGLLEAIENAGDDMNIVTASSCVEIIAFGSEGHDHGDDHDHEGDDHDHEEGEEHAHEDEDHAHEEGEDHAHEGEEMGDMSALATLCEQHYAEMEAIHEAGHEHDHEEGEDHDHEEGEEHEHEEGEGGHDHSHVETLGALYAIDCGAGHSHDHEGEEHEHEEGEEHAHDHGSCDPHVWMEPHNVMYWTMLIRDTLIELDPANAETYTANAAAYLEELDMLAHDFVMPMVETVPEENRVLITNHDAFGYFAARHDFEVAITIIPAGSTLAEPSAADVAAVIDLIREEGVPAIFAETTVNDDLAQQIADETGAEVFVLYSGSLSEADGPASTYVDYIRYNVTTIVEALGGGM
jgi:zinc/manganese transport system substrate-binding protein